MQTVNLIQGSLEWKLHRANHFNASDAPAMMGVSEYKTRDQLLYEMATGITPDIHPITQKRFDDGHEFEALARPVAEQIIGEEVSPIVGVDGSYSASFDGITFDNTIAFEHKTLNDKLRKAEFDDGGYHLPAMYRIQMEQQLMISGAERCLFMASKWVDGALEEERHCWYLPDLKLRQQIMAGWEQFRVDLAAYVPPVIVEKVEASPARSLPVPSVVVRGEITASNLDAITPMFDLFLKEIKTELKTDQDFVDADENGKRCREMAVKIKALRGNIIAQMVDVNTVDSRLQNYEAAFNNLGLSLEKAVKTQKQAIKDAAVLQAQNDYLTFIGALESALPFTIRQKLDKPNFVDAIKGVQKIDSMNSRLNDALAKGKAEATTLANDVKSKLAYITEAIKGYEHLFVVQELCFKDVELIKLHIQSIKDAENKRKAEHEAAIQAKAEADARAKLEAEQRAKELAEKAIQQTTTVPVVMTTSVTQPVDLVVKAASYINASSLASDLVEPFNESDFRQVFSKNNVATKAQVEMVTPPSAEQLAYAVSVSYSVEKSVAYGWLVNAFSYAKEPAIAFG